MRVRIAEHHYRLLQGHLFPGDRDEHAALILAGVMGSGAERTLLVREVHPVRPNDFPPGRHGYRQIAPRPIAEIAGRAGDEGLAYLSAHSHPGAGGRVGLSEDDLAAHRRLFPHLLDLTAGGPVGGLVLGEASAAGEIWTADARPRPLASLTVVGTHIRTLSPAPGRAPSRVDPRFDRQARLFGAEGQRRLRGMRVGVVGVGGGGSLIVQQLAHLGVGELVLVDPDIVEQSNLSRIVGARLRDARRRRPKVRVMRRLVASIDRSIDVAAIQGDVLDLDVASRLREVDFLFLATDTIASRLVVNALVQQYLIPSIQIGARIELRPAGGDIEEVYVAVRPVLPARGCLYCNGLIDPARLQVEQRSDEERRAQNYVGAPEVTEPAVISLNALAASQAVTAMLFSALGLADEVLLDHRLFFVRDGNVHRVATSTAADCPFCGSGTSSAYARGDPVERLPCRRTAASARSARSLMRRSLAQLAGMANRR